MSKGINSIDSLFEASWKEVSKPAEYCGVGVEVIDKEEARKLFHRAAWLSNHKEEQMKVLTQELGKRCGMGPTIKLTARLSEHNNERGTT